LVGQASLELYAIETPECYLLTPYDPAIEEQLRAAEFVEPALARPRMFGLTGAIARWLLPMGLAWPKVTLSWMAARRGLWKN
jgi:hypothetical protein